MNWKRMKTGRRFLLAAGLTLALTLGLVGTVARAAETETYIIRFGDTLVQVAATHETTVAEILALNPGLDANNLYVGRTIQVPIPPEPGTVAAQCPRSYTTRAGDTWDAIAAAHRVDAGVLALVNNKAQTQALAVGTELCIPVIPPAVGTGAAATRTPTPPAVATGTPTPMAVAAKPTALPVTAQQLLQDFRDNEVRGDQLHKGQVKYVTGQINDIRDGGSGYYLVLGYEGDEWDFGQVHCQLRDPEQAVALRTGQAVTVRGRIAGLGLFDIIDIEDCAVTSAEAVPPSTARLAPADPASDTVTAQQLLQDFRDNEVRGDQLHKGQVKYVTGRIDDIRDGGSGYYIDLGYEGDEWDFGQVHCQLRDPERAVALRTGQAVTVRGRIAGLGLFDIIDIEDCAVTSAEAVPPSTARLAPADPASDTVTAQQLLQDFRDNEVRGDQLHKGQVKYVTGRIDDIRDGGSGYYIDLGYEGDEWDFGQVHCQLRDPEQAAELKAGQAVTIRGRIAGLGLFDVIEIEDCRVEN